MDSVALCEKLRRVRAFLLRETIRASVRRETVWADGCLMAYFHLAYLQAWGRRGKGAEWKVLYP